MKNTMLFVVVMVFSMLTPSFAENKQPVVRNCDTAGVQSLAVKTVQKPILTIQADNPGCCWSCSGGGNNGFCVFGCGKPFCGLLRPVDNDPIQVGEARHFKEGLFKELKK